jgi:hypothetical protein
VTGSRCLLPARRLSLPAAVDRRRIVWLYASTVGLCHLIALLAVLPWFFSWSGLALTFAGIYVFGGLGINLGYHRLLTHCTSGSTSSGRCSPWWPTGQRPSGPVSPIPQPVVRRTTVTAAGRP